MSEARHAPDCVAREFARCGDIGRSVPWHLCRSRCCTPPASYAHHNQFQGFDPDKQQVVTGTVERFAWQNPHAYIYVASGEGNAARSWRIETLSIAFMRRMGWGPDTLRAGDNVTVTINPSRTADRATGWLIDLAVEGREVPSLTDEQRVGAIFSGESTQTDARASSVIGTWITVIDSGRAVEVDR